MVLILLKILIGLLILRLASCTIDGLSYMDPLKFGPYQNNAATENPCNPLYWYPKHIPDYCYEKPFIKTNTTKYIPLPVPVPMPPPFRMPFPVPIPIGYPLPFGVPLAPTAPMLPALMPPVMPAIPPPMPPIPPPMSSMLPGPMSPMMPGPMSPMMPGPMSPMMAGPMSPMMPGSVQPSPYSYPQQQIGMVPGLPGMVSPDGGINILPFSDAYSDVLEKHKQKMMNKRLRRILDDYDEPYWSRRSSSRKRGRKVYYN